MKVFDAAHKFRPIDFSVLDCYGVAESSNSDASFVEISTAEPFRIHNVSQKWLDLFQFSNEEIAGRSLRVVCGPATRMADLRQAIATAANGKEAKAPICFYSSVGVGKFMAVQAQPCDDQSACRLTMVPSDAVPMKEAMQMEHGSRAIVSAQKPHTIQHVNSAFATDLEMEQEMCVGKPIRMLQGPRTNSPAMAQMLNGAMDGLSRTQELVLYTSTCEEHVCEASAIPLLSSDGSIAYVMVVLKPIAYGDVIMPSGLTEIEAKLHSLCFPTNTAITSGRVKNEEGMGSSFCSDRSRGRHGSACAQQPAFPPPPSHISHISTCMDAPPSMRETVPSAPFHFPQPYAAQEHLPSLPHHPPAQAAPFDARASPSVTSSSDAAASSGDGVAVLRLVPRKKQLASGECVELTAARLEQLGGKSMKAAAAELGIAASTLKKACRRLGVERWPSGTQAAGGKSKGLDYDSGYVRRLFAKYKPKAPGPGRADGCPSPGAVVPQGGGAALCAGGDCYAAAPRVAIASGAFAGGGGMEGGLSAEMWAWEDSLAGGGGSSRLQPVSEEAPMPADDLCGEMGGALEVMGGMW